jgi:hypothetical protein
MKFIPLGTPPAIKCAMRSCEWKGIESDRVPHPADVGKASQRLVCPDCNYEKFSFLGRKGAPTGAYLDVKATEAETVAQ